MQQNPTQADVLNNVALFDLNISLWSGRVKLYQEDLERTGHGYLMADMPEDVINLGSKRIFPQESLRTFNSLKYKAEKAIRRKGFRSYSAFVVPRPNVDGIVAELESLRRQFMAERDDLKVQYRNNLEDHAAKFPKWRDVILGSAPSAEVVYSKLHFNYRYFLLAGEESVGEAGEGDVKHSLIDELLDEISHEANSFWEDIIKARDKIPRVSIRRLEALSEKMKGFSFIDPRLEPMIEFLDESLGRIPSEGPIEGTSFDTVNSAVLMLTDPNREKSYGQAVIDTESSAEVAETQIDERPANHESTPALAGVEEEEDLQPSFLF